MRAALLVVAVLAGCSTDADCPCGDCSIDLRADSSNCGACGRVCGFDNARAGCRAGGCQLLGCDDGWLDENGVSADGCEARLGPGGQRGRGEGEGEPAGGGPCPIGYALDPDGVCAWDELACDGVDDDGDGITDDGRCEAVHFSGHFFFRGLAGGASWHAVELPYDFAIDRYETAAGNYRGCLEAGGCSEIPACPDGVTLDDLADREPVRCLSWCAALDYCLWTGKRLPTELELARAARGLDGRRFPWGGECPVTEAACGRANLSGSRSCDCFAPDGPAPSLVDEAEERVVTAEGAVHIAGNVLEWAWDWFPGGYGPAGRNVKLYADDGELVRDLWEGITPADPARATYKSVGPGDPWTAALTWGAGEAQGKRLDHRDHDVGMRCARTLELHLPASRRSDLHAPLLPGTEADAAVPSCEVTAGCGDAVSEPSVSLHRLEITGGSLTGLPAELLAPLRDVLRAGIGRGGIPLLFVEDGGGQALLGAAATQTDCSPVAWIAAYPPARLAERACAGRCFEALDGQRSPLPFGGMLTQPLPLADVRLAFEGMSPGERGTLQAAIVAAEVEEIGFGASTLGELIRQLLTDEGGGAPERFTLELSFEVEGDGAPERPSAGACEACRAEGL